MVVHQTISKALQRVVVSVFFNHGEIAQKIFSGQKDVLTVIPLNADLKVGVRPLVSKL